MRRLAIHVALAAIASAQPPPATLSKLLSQVRAEAPQHADTRGASPVFTDIKHQLRDWIESRLPSLQPYAALDTFSSRLNSELVAANLACPDDQCWQKATGHLGSVVISQSQGHLIVQTKVGIECGMDESAYVYRHEQGRWLRVLSHEQTDYRQGKYLPQFIRRIAISPAESGPRADPTRQLVALISDLPWCASNWRAMYYYVWLLKGSNSTILTNGVEEHAYAGGSVQISAAKRRMLIEYEVGSADTGILIRPQVRHYVLDPDIDQLFRIDPFALSPRDFVDHWLRTPDPALHEHAAPAVVQAFQHWRTQFPMEFFEFAQPTMHCPDRPDLWQVSVLKQEATEPSGYFLVLWKPPYRFTLVDVTTKPNPTCTEPDFEADETRTLFPVTDYQ